MRTPSRFLLALGLVAGCADSYDAADVGQTDRAQIMMNQIMMNQIMMNGLTGTIEALEQLVSHPLATATFDPVFGALPVQLHDPDARLFMAYLVSCALEPGDSVSWSDPFDGNASYEWSGALGVCPAWADGPPSPACLEAVTGCLLARENALGKSVMLSPRGRRLPSIVLGKSTAIPLSAEVAAKATDLDGDLLASFGDCAVTTTGAARNCGWSATRSLLGTCSPGEEVDLACTSGSRAMAVRVCEGTGGCNHGSTRRIAEFDSVCGSGKTEISFTCGAGDDAFAVMIGGTTTGLAIKGRFAATAGAVFPASEAELHLVEEGAFYGNLFNPARRHPGVRVEVDPGTGAIGHVIDTWVSPGSEVYDDSYSCGAPEWTHHDAYFHHRLCAIVADDLGTERELCLSHNVGRCTTPGPAVNLCGSTDGPPVLGDGDYAACADTAATVRAYPLTVYLHDPCDLVPPNRPDLCERGGH